jgi:hypothetical protein
MRKRILSMGVSLDGLVAPAGTLWGGGLGSPAR